MNESHEKYFVWNPDGRQPRFEHESYYSAVIEAKRLARSNPGEKFYVLGTLALAQVRDPVEVTAFNFNPEIPF